MPSKTTDMAIQQRIDIIKPEEEDKYTDIPGNTGEYLSYTNSAVLLVLVPKHGRRLTIWFPCSQLRRSEDGELYASNWILEQKHGEIFG